MSRAFCCFWLVVLAGAPWAIDSACFADAVAAAYDLGRYPFSRDPQAAFRWYRKAALRGDANAAFSVGTMCYRGEGVQPDAQAAAHWWRRAAELGDASGQKATGDAYCMGLGVTPDSDEARRWWKLAAMQGNPDAARKLQSERCADRPAVARPRPTPAI